MAELQRDVTQWAEGPGSKWGAEHTVLNPGGERYTVATPGTRGGGGENIDKRAPLECVGANWAAHIKITIIAAALQSSSSGRK